LTRKKVSIVSGKDIFAVNDPTLNINIDNNTCAGIIPQSISQPYTPFGNRPEFNRYGDDGSKCVLDANGVLTWIGNTISETKPLTNPSRP
jgi:hypothetical protein